MGDRTVAPDEELDMRTVNIKVQDLGGDDEQFDVLNCELDASYIEIELGDIDMFELEDYDRE